ncbi:MULTISPECIES: helix-turn-helix domain-containing protein [Rhodomicrobium]|uniref:helix-turn-helix domain-containing protein n=1 Tax=Rhodomicrobium TaxID=1068 RepID=UPI001482AA14|nr:MULTISPECIES: helix-turn-helix domain-containing protein [Rhodomicrobium]
MASIGFPHETHLAGAPRFGHLPAPLEKFDSTAIVKRGCRGQEISARNAKVGYLFFVMHGVARKFAIQSDGHRRIVDLLLPGDIVSLDRGRGEDFFLEAAVNDTVIAGYTLRRIEELTAGDVQFAHKIHEMILQCVRRLERQLLIQGRVTALEKVAGFLLEFAGRLTDDEAAAVSLPISRYDIADFIGVSSETVCRCMTELTRRGAIALPRPREVRIVNRAVLEDME